MRLSEALSFIERAGDLVDAPCSWQKALRLFSEMEQQELIELGVGRRKWHLNEAGRTVLRKAKQ